MARSINKPMMMIDGDEDLTKKLIADAKKRQDKSSSSQKKPNEQAGTTAAQRDATETRAAKLREAMYRKGVSGTNMKYIVASAGSQTAAENAVINAPQHVIDAMIKDGKRKIDEEKVREENSPQYYDGSSDWNDYFNQRNDEFKLQTEMNNKDISQSKYSRILAYFGGDTEKANEFIFSKTINQINSFLTPVKSPDEYGIDTNNKSSSYASENDKWISQLNQGVEDFKVDTAKRTKSITDEDYQYLIDFYGSEEDAKTNLLNLSQSQLDSAINSLRYKEKQNEINKIGKSISYTDNYLLLQYFDNDSGKVSEIIKTMTQEELDKIIDEERNRVTSATHSLINAEQNTNSEIFKNALLQKGLSENDFRYIMAINGNDRTKAEQMVMNKMGVELRSLIERQKQEQFIPDVSPIFQTNKARGKYEDKYGGNVAGIFYGVDDDKDDLKSDGSKEPMNIAYKGCGIVSTVMGIETFGGYDDDGSYYEHVEEAAKYSLDGGYKDEGGTDIKTLTVDYANEKGLDAYHTEDMNEVMEALARGDIVVASVNNEPKDDMFTSGSGHIITLTNINPDGSIEIVNPNKDGYYQYEAGNTTYTAEQIDSHRNNGYVIIEQP